MFEYGCYTAEVSLGVGSFETTRHTCLAGDAGVSTILHDVWKIFAYGKGTACT